MKILFLGDIVARPGREAVIKIIPELKQEFEPDLIIANAENIAGGKGVTEKTLNDLTRSGIDFFTSGNHVWKARDQGHENHGRTDPAQAWRRVDRGRDLA